MEIKNFLIEQDWKKIFLSALPFLFIFIIIFLLFYRIEFNPKNPYFSGEDAFYHVGMAKYIMEHGIPQKFPYLYFTTLNNGFVDHQLLFHLILIPFIKIFGEITGPKLLNITFFAGCFSMLYLFFREKKLKLAVVYPLIIFFLLPSDFYFRSAFIRVQCASLFFMLLALYLIFSRKYLWLGIISFFFVWLYGGSVFLPVLIICYLLSAVFFNEKINWRLPAYGFGGFLAGLILNPFFPKDIFFLISQIFATGLGAKSYSGGEWRPYDSWYWFQISLFPISIFLTSIFFSQIPAIKKNVKTTTIILFALIMLIFEWKAKRFVEYWPLLASFAGFYLIAEYIEDQFINWKSNIKKMSGIIIFVVLILVIPFFINYGNEQLEKGLSDTRTTWNVDSIKQVHGKLMSISEPGDIVFTDDWDVFPIYFFFNRQNNYIVGLDPEFMNQYDPVLYNEFASISSGRDDSRLERIKNDFKAKWVLVADDHMKFKSNLEAEPDLFEKVFDNGHYFLFQVK